MPATLTTTDTVAAFIVGAMFICGAVFMFAAALSIFNLFVGPGYLHGDPDVSYAECSACVDAEVIIREEEDHDN